MDIEAVGTVYLYWLVITIKMCVVVVGSFLAYAFFRNIEHYSIHRELIRQCTPSSDRKMDKWFKEDDETHPFSIGNVGSTFWIILLCSSVISIGWPVAVFILFGWGICEIAYKMRGQDRLAETLKGTLENE